MDDGDNDDFLGGAVIDFGDGKQYTVAPSEVPQTSGSNVTIPNSATPQDRLGDDFDRSWPPRLSPGAPTPQDLPTTSPSTHFANSHADGKGERSNRVEPYSRESRFPQRSTSGSYHPPGKGAFREPPPHGLRDQESSSRSGGDREFPAHERDRDAHGARRPSYAERERDHRERNSYRRDDDYFNSRGRMGPPPLAGRGDYHPHGHPPGNQPWDNRSAAGRSRRGSQASSTAPYAPSVRDHSRESTKRNRSRETNAGDRQMPPHLQRGRSSVGPVTSPSSLNARVGSWRTSPTVPTRPPPGSGGGSFRPPSSAGSHTGRGRLNSDVSSRGTGEPTAAPSSNQSLHAMPLAPALGDPGVDPDVVVKTTMAEAAERARRRKQEDEEEREKERERARKKAEEIEAKIKATEEEERKKKEAEEEERRKVEEEREEKERKRKEREEQQKGKDAQRPSLPARPSISDRADSWRTKAAPLPPLPNKPARAPSISVNGTTTMRSVPVAIIHEVVALDMNHDDLEVVDFVNMRMLVEDEKDSSPAQEKATPLAETPPASGKLPSRPEAPLKSDTVSNWRKAPTVTEPEVSPKAADAKLPLTKTSPMTSTLPLPGARNLASSNGKSLRPSPLTLVDNHVSRASNVRRTSQEGSHLITIHTPTQPLHSPRTPKTGDFVPYREAPISVLDDTMSRFKEALLQSNPNSAKLDGSMMAAMEEGPNGHGISAAKSPTGLAFSILNRTKPTPTLSAPTPSELRSALSKAAGRLEKTETKTSNGESPQEATAGDVEEEVWTQTQEPLNASPPGSDVRPTINIPAQSTKKESIPSKRINAAKSIQLWRWDTLTLDPPMPAMSKKTLSVIDVLMPSGGSNKKPVVRVPPGSRPSSPATLLAPAPSADTAKKPKKDQKESVPPAGTSWAPKKGGSEEAVWRRGVPVQGPAKKGPAAPKAQEVQTSESASTASTAGSTTVSAAPVSRPLHELSLSHLYIYRRMLCLLRPTHQVPSGEDLHHCLRSARALPHPHLRPALPKRFGVRIQLLTRYRPKTHSRISRTSSLPQCHNPLQR